MPSQHYIIFTNYLTFMPKTRNLQTRIL